MDIEILELEDGICSVAPKGRIDTQTAGNFSEAMEEDESGRVVVNFSLDGDDYTLVVNEGDGSGMAEPEKPEVNQDPVLSIGDELHNRYIGHQNMPRCLWVRCNGQSL